MKDYYAILHVLPTAEIDVIQAAFRALSRKYHPDTCTGDKAAASKRMQDINEAYGVLGDVKKRAEYDAKRKADNQEDDFSSNGNGEDIDSRLEEDWKIACKYCPDAEDDFAHLNKLSRSLAFAFKSYLLDTKQFSECQKLRDKFRAEFLKNYFGSNPDIQEIGERLVMAGELAAAKSVNRAAKVMGAALDVGKLIAALRSDHPHVNFPEMRPDKTLIMQSLFQAVRRRAGNTLVYQDALDYSEKLLKEMGIPFTKNGFLCRYSITLYGRTETTSYRNVATWIIDNLGSRPEFKGL